MNVYLEPIFHIVEMDTIEQIHILYYINGKITLSFGVLSNTKTTFMQKYTITIKNNVQDQWILSKKNESHKPHCKGEIYWGANWRQMTQLTIYY